MIRIIAGKYKGRVLTSPKVEKIRPTTQKVREAVFSIIGERIYGAKFLDLFSGTGAIGIEAISRGADRVYFCDSSYKSIKILKENLSFCDDEEYEIITGKYENSVAKIMEPVDIVYLDPPYYMNSLEDILKSIAPVVKKEGFVIFEHGSTQEAFDEYEGFLNIGNKKYGNIYLSLYKKEA